MSDHYYSRTPNAGSDRKIHETMLRGRTFRLTTDSGVFSKTGVDYGSRVLIETLELPENASVLDVGCGYGPIGLAAASMVPDGHVTMIDINERAVRLAGENAALNGLSERVTVLQSDLFEAVNGRQFDAIVTNPPIRAGKQVVHRIFEEGFGLLKPGGSMWVVIQKKQGAPSATARLQDIFGNVRELGKDKGYRILRAVKESQTNQ
ncbi:16S rRNA methyltransferase [Paenibacillus darwinianus]|uniref:16S rRNA methyltransferase n=1 Tax=Paenibacillus darwinianus TaxID=1380763 RepID=A0A9W5W810_9BACL|nr:class I SAM-dependent methyltransferase [Paenibacillus darwinianus]EXX89083.1 16S rRNA methyltransferase [Paenibacillus darwinianus]EXX89570.1 16S rRNA methyltransferase [Paenibacillus darwinianus]EXX90335.1 16S rRNA methyltransferase [Paenibacillus darwinianus]